MPDGACMCVEDLLHIKFIFDSEQIYFEKSLAIMVRNVRRLVLIILNQIHNVVCSSCL